MADKKISQLSAATTPLAGTEVLPIVQSGATVKVSVADLTAGRTVDATTVNATTVDATNVEVTNVKAKDGTAAVTIADSTGAVTVSSGSTLDGGVVINELGADVDFRVESDTNANALFLDAGTSRVGINNAAPITDLDITGSVLASGNLQGLRFYSQFLQQSIADNTWVTYFTLADLQGSAYLVTASKARESDTSGSHMATMIVTKDGTNTAAATALASVGTGVELRLDGANIQAQRVSPYNSGGARGVIVAMLRLA